MYTDGIISISGVFGASLRKKGWDFDLKNLLAERLMHKSNSNNQ